MTSQTFRFSEYKANFMNRVLTIVLSLMATVSINAQQSAPMEALIGQSLSKIQ